MDVRILGWPTTRRRTAGPRCPCKSCNALLPARVRMARSVILVPLQTAGLIDTRHCYHRRGPWSQRGLYAKYCDERACVSLSVREHFSKTRCPNFTTFSLYVAHGRGSVLLWRHCHILCTCDFVDDVLFAHIRSGKSDANRAYTQGSKLLSIVTLFLCFSFVIFRHTFFDVRQSILHHLLNKH